VVNHALLRWPVSSLQIIPFKNTIMLQVNLFRLVQPFNRPMRCDNTLRKLNCISKLARELQGWVAIKI
jgi:hypothetical protein